MAQPSINMPQEMLDEIDDRRESTTSRSKWIRQAVEQRFEREDEAAVSAEGSA